ASTIKSRAVKLVFISPPSSCTAGQQKLYAENELPQPHPPVEFGFLNVNPEPCIEVTYSIVTPFRYCAENGSTNTLNPSRGMTRSSSAARSSMTRLYLKPLQPPGWTLTRSPPCSAVTPSASINFLTSTPAFGVTARSISGC